jgi:5-methyltetrahydropteroyltriglutamate--homocysteine methyltransferase
VGVLWASVLGGYPRGRIARYAMRDLDSGSVEPYRALLDLERASSLVVGAQLASGMRFIVDGMLDWHDIFRPFAESWRNVYLDGIIRYFDNNFFYRIPVFRGEPEPQKLVLPGRVRALSPLAEPAGIKVVIPGPLTFIKLGRNESGIEDEELVLRVAAALAIEAREAAKAGADLIQVDEPYLTDVDATPDDARLAVEAFNSIAREVKKETDAKIGMALYFNAPKKDVYGEVLEAKADYMSIDIADSPKRSLELLLEASCGDAKPVLGVIDARRIYDDDYDKVKGYVEKALSACKNAEEAGLTTSTWLDLIPPRFSLRKTALLGAYTERIARELGLEALIPISSKPKPYLDGGGDR